MQTDKDGGNEVREGARGREGGVEGGREGGNRMGRTKRMVKGVKGGGGYCSSVEEV